MAESRDPAAALASEGPSHPPGAPDAGNPAAAAAAPRSEAAAPDNGRAAAPALEPEYLANIEIPDGGRQSYERFGAAMKADGLQPKIGNAVLAWLAAARKNGAPPEQAGSPHGYSIDGRFSPEVQPYIASFASAMRAAGASQRDVDAALRAYGRWERASAGERVAAYRENEQLDREDAHQARNWLREKFGDSAPTVYSELRDYLNRLPPASRERLEQDRDAEGVAALNSPARLEQLLANARGPLPTDRVSIDAELAALREKMKNPRAWAKDEAGQRRYRLLLTQRGS